MAGSTLILEEHFRNADPRFLPELLSIRDDKHLARWPERWWSDKRPPIRAAMLAYIDDGCLRPGHRPLIKGLFKRAEKAGDVEVLAHFLAAFDRMTAGPTSARTGKVRRVRLPYGTFRAATRHYLQRRTWRWFRELGRTRPEAYVPAISQALRLYEDVHTDDVAKLLRSWGLCHALWHHSPVLSWHPVGVDVAAGRSLGELAPAPIYAEQWSAEALLGLVEARCRTVRAWAVAVLRRDHPGALTGWDFARISAWLRSPHDELVELATSLLRGAKGLDKLPLAEWLGLLAVENPAAMGVIVELFEKHVAPSRVGDQELVAMASSRLAPVAELGARWLIAREPSLEVLAALVDAPVESVRAQAVERMVARIGAGEGSPEVVRDLIDSRHEEVRTLALWMLDDPRFSGVASLWAALTESPWHDVRAFLIGRLERRVAAEARPGPEALRHVWATAMLGVHRGGRARRQALDQLAARISEAPSEADGLLPIVRVALRGVRAPERAAALAKVVQLVQRGALDRALVARHVPELSFPEESL